MPTRPPLRASVLGLAAIVALLVAACAPTARPAAPSGETTSARAPAATAAQSAPAQPAPGATAAAPAIPDVFRDAMTISFDELHQKAVAEGGTLVYYGPLAQINAEKILPGFEARFPGVKVEQIDGTNERIAGRLMTEARGGKVLADVLEISQGPAVPLARAGLFLEALPPEAEAYPAELRGPYWLGVGMTVLVAAWNTNLVRPDEAPRSLEDLADPRWRDRLMIEPSDTAFLVGLVRKYGNEAQAVDLLRRVAANNPEFHRGHSELAELLAAGQGAACLTCYSHHFPTRMRRGVPLDYLLAEGVGQITTTMVLKDAPHPYAAMLWQRYIHTEEGQQLYADGGRTPVHPNVQPRDKTRPDRVYVVAEDDVDLINRYDRQWRDLFQLR